MYVYSAVLELYVNFCANDLKFETVRLSHVAANYYGARRLMVVFADLQDLKNI